ncbi:MAG: hypothetical protein HDP28_02255 [Clostridia bacterium]|nr:hypothetical protein [Clostridia bacterium]
MTVLRVTFCILACLCAASAVPIGIFFEWWCLVPVAAAFLFAFLMFAAKNNFTRPKKEARTDFMNSDEENEKIRNQNDENKN